MCIIRHFQSRTAEHETKRGVRLGIGSVSIKLALLADLHSDVGVFAMLLHAVHLCLRAVVYIYEEALGRCAHVPV